MVGAGTGRVTEGGELRHRDEALFPEEKISEEWSSYVCLSVTDTGCGMDAETLPRIFEQFYQGETDRRADGCGLGLTLCKRIVEQHGGTISAESRPGEGSRFSVVLPAKAAKFM